MDFRKLLLAGLLLPGTAAAAFTISSVSNAASRVPAGFPSAGIAQGAVFSVVGTGVGQDSPTQATFPLPTSAGLAGVSMKAAVGSVTVDAIMVYVSANEVDAILPSNTPLGTGTLTVNNGGVTATSPITVVTSAFGIFTAIPGGFGSALAFVTNDDGSTTLVSPFQPAHAGQTVRLVGTGLGAIAGDETQSGAGGTPGASVILWLGNQQVPVSSASRGSCCTGIDPTYPVPAGVAGWDQITFTIPDGISGCTLSIAVQIGNMVSNVPSIAVANSSGSCIDLTGVTFDAANLSGTIKTGLESFIRLTTKDYEAAGTNVVTVEVGAAAFQAVTLDANLTVVPASLLPLLATVAGNCSVTVSRFDRSVPPPAFTGTPGTPPVILDAGAAINVKSPVAAKPMPNGKDGSYSASFANIINIPLPGGLPPITSGGPPFLDPGAYVLDNGGGGADIGPFSVNMTGPAEIAWDNIDQVSTVNRAQGVTIKWSGGDPSTVVGIGGSAILIQGTVSLSGSFQCIERTSAGQFAIPPFVTLSMPVTNVSISTNNNSIISVSEIQYNYLPIPGVDSNVTSWVSGTGRNVGFQ